MADPVVIATWPFGKTAVDTALPLLAAGKPALDAVITGAQAVENDPAVRSVGFGSLPDRIGQLTLDSCVMDGKTLACGAVAGLQHIRSASAVARRVMEKTPHVLLVGEGAKWFALQEGFKLEMPHTVEAIREWFEKHPEAKKKPKPAKRPPAPHDDLPVATVVGGLSAAPVVTAPAQLVKPERASAAPAGLGDARATPFGRQFAGLLKGPNALALAVALQEVLGPPKCKRG
ncbi:MAG: isoaspartyl peptidase/L-asparaginase [Gemmataceae bacterium]